MSKHEEALNGALWELMQATGKQAKEARFAEATAALDALLAEHRAEVEVLSKALEDEVFARPGSNAAGWKSRAEALKGERDTICDAALEEAADVGGITARDSIATTVGGLQEEVSEAIRALRSQPARRYVDVEKVCQAIRDTRRESADMLEADERDFLRRLGVDLDANGNVCSRCHHPTQQHDPKGACGTDHCLCNGEARP